MVKITTLIDNYAMPGTDLESEHGFSCFVETNQVRILFDTGKDGAFIRNAEKLGIDLGTIDHLVISHAHYDHGGGVVPLLETFSLPALSLWTGKKFSLAKYADEEDGMRYLGLDFDARYAFGKQVMWHTVCNDTVMIHPGIWLVSGFDRIHPIEQPNPRFVIEEEGVRKIDTFCDEIALVIDTPQGLVLIVGCSHPGILNILDSVRSRFSKPLYALMGGIHLFDASPERRDTVVRDLIERSIPRLGASHCTGDEAANMLSERYPGYFPNMSGTVTMIG